MHKIRVFDTVFAIDLFLSEQRNQLKKIGLVPTMGALHHGHVSLVEAAFEDSDFVVVSIFVNPTQFNNSQDLEKYPRTLESDLKMLSNFKDVIVFCPSVEEMYPLSHQKPEIDLGLMGEVMEGKFRPGHFDGVVEVVKRLFEIVKPNLACFGEKDFQQLAVISYMTNYFKLPVEVVGCSIVREENGLAMSSRNLRLSESQKNEAVVIYQTLKFVRENQGNFSPSELATIAGNKLKESSLEMEYLSIVDPDSLEELSENWVPGARCCTAAFCGEVRLIDNMKVN